ncbi:MAG: hypothetical protein HQ591_01400 [candidate division Zixibacteria bacterium]|nr:hypothetical protein [Candidatus Tariuqbacter arcticus]
MNDIIAQGRFEEIDMSVKIIFEWEVRLEQQAIIMHITSKWKENNKKIRTKSFKVNKSKDYDRIAFSYITKNLQNFYEEES